MGVSWHFAKALIAARAKGISFENTVTLGRLNLFIDKNNLEYLCYLYELNTPNIEKYFVPLPTYSEPFLQMLGAEKVDSLDASNYEGATIIHDMNQPIPEQLVDTYDVLVDGGTLEHIFNLPVALSNYMKLVKPGGSIMIHTHANNSMGHGFYDFSPELFYRVFSLENGFEIQRIIVFERYDFSQWYEVVDPKNIQARVELISNRYSIGIIVHAKKLFHVDEPLKITPQQSDYATAWAQGTSPLKNYKHTDSLFLNRLRLESKKKFPSLIAQIKRWQVYNKNQKLFSFEAQPSKFIPVNK